MDDEDLACALIEEAPAATDVTWQRFAPLVSRALRAPRSACARTPIALRDSARIRRRDALSTRAPPRGRRVCFTLQNREIVSNGTRLLHPDTVLEALPD
jgi:hypothetical protein